MISVINEISGLRAGKPMIIDYQNSNRYRLVVQEENGTKTAYNFSVPLYNLKSGRIVDLRFHQNGENIYLNGSNSAVTVGQNLKLENAEGNCLVYLDAGSCFFSEQRLQCSGFNLFPTTNGIAVKTQKPGAFTFELEAGEPCLNLWNNDRCFALMKEKFRPFVTVSCIGTLNQFDRVIAPATLLYQKLSDRRCRLSVSPCSPLGNGILFEINLYEPKLLQDTTVESLKPSTNNAFGSAAFIGNTTTYGEQWLYSRLDNGKLPELADRHIYKAVMHFPVYSAGIIPFCAFKVSARFCSFGSNWKNKIAGEEMVSESIGSDAYQSVDMTNLFVGHPGRFLALSEGFILRAKIKDNGFCAVATGDSCFSPEILEVNYR